MRHVRMLGICVIALLGLAALAATGTASAAGPEWGACVEAKSLGLKHGHYEDSNCTKEKYKENAKTHAKTYSGKYEWKAGAPAAPECLAKKHGNYLTSACNTEKEKKGVVEPGKGKYEKGGPNFTGEAGAGVLSADEYGCFAIGTKSFSGPGNRVPHEDCTHKEAAQEYTGLVASVLVKIECATENATGQAVGSNEIANVNVRFTGCQYNGVPAQGVGLPAGEIRTNTLKGHLGYINEGKHEVGVLLEPAVAGGQFAEFEFSLGGPYLLEHVGVGNATEGTFYEEHSPADNSGHDGIISPVTPVNQMTHTFTQNYRIEDIGPHYEPNSCSLKVIVCNDLEVLKGEGVWDDLNTPSHFEGGPLEALEVYQANQETGKGTIWSPAGEEISNVNTVEGEAEIKA